MASDDDPPVTINDNMSEDELRKESEKLKAKIAEARRVYDIPLDSALGSPSWEAQAADGRFDKPEDEDE